VRITASRNSPAHITEQRDCRHLPVRSQPEKTELHGCYKSGIATQRGILQGAIDILKTRGKFGNLKRRHGSDVAAPGSKRIRQTGFFCQQRACRVPCCRNLTRIVEKFGTRNRETSRVNAPQFSGMAVEDFERPAEQSSS
jgi:hypothetical protein